MEIFIPGNCPSLKNSKRVVRLKNGRTVVLPPKTVDEYLRKHEWNYQTNKDKFRNECLKTVPPYKVGFYFKRDSKRRFDYINAAQIVQDLMVKHGWIQDDNADFLIPVFEGYEIDKDNPGVTIKLL